MYVHRPGYQQIIRCVIMQLINQPLCLELQACIYISLCDCWTVTMDSVCIIVTIVSGSNLNVWFFENLAQHNENDYIMKLKKKKRHLVAMAECLFTIFLVSIKTA